MKIFKVLICLLLLVCNFTISFAEEAEEEEIQLTSEEEDYEEENYEEEEEELSDYELCFYNKDKDACTRVTQDKRDSIKRIEDQIKEAENDRDAARDLAIEYAGKAASLQGEIDALTVKIEELKTQITTLETNIAELEEKISTNQATVDKLHSRVKARMVETQKTMHFNYFLDFLLGATSFSDMLGRIYSIQAIVSKDEADRAKLIDVINQLEADKEELNNKKSELESSKDELDASYYDIISKQEELVAMQEFYEEEEARIQDELDRMTEERDTIYESFEDLRRMLKEVNMIVNTGFVPAVHNSWITSTVWNYSDDFLNGKWHLGVDYAASRGTAIHAPAGGVIIRANADCGDPGYLGSYCGNWISGGGNQVYMMAEVDGKVYGFIFFHMNSISVSYGDYVQQDEVIGYVGSSGSSTGPHCHIEMYYLGAGDLFDYLDMGWNATFSVGRGATAYGNRCYYDDGTFRQGPPCILNPEWYLPAN